jgi:hypothetical protein
LLASGTRWVSLSRSRLTSPVNPSPSRPTSDSCTRTCSGLRSFLSAGCGSPIAQTRTARSWPNPNIGYGAYTITYADGSARESYRIGLSANTTGISVYVLGLDDKTYLARTYGASIGKASVTGYCIKFKRLAAISADVLHTAIRHGMTVDQTG